MPRYKGRSETNYETINDYMTQHGHMDILTMLDQFDEATQLRQKIDLAMQIIEITVGFKDGLLTNLVATDLHEQLTQATSSTTYADISIHSANLMAGTASSEPNSYERFLEGLKLFADHPESLERLRERAQAIDPAHISFPQPEHSDNERGKGFFQDGV